MDKSAPDPVNHPPHYTSHPSGVECITVTRHMSFNLGNVVKYLWRAGLKDQAPTLQDLRKAAWYLQDEIAKLEREKKTDLSDIVLIDAAEGRELKLDDTQKLPVLKTHIELTPAEIQSGLDRVKWAEGLIKQLPVDHQGRNSWLLNYGDPRPLSDCAAVKVTQP